MHNSPELNIKIMGSISSDFVKVAETLKETSYLMRSRAISEYPIFPTSEVPLPIGALLTSPAENPGLELKRNYYISFLDEFVQRNLVAPDAIDMFKEAWRDADEYCCLFVVQPDFTNFVFIPYPED
jgi:hypothetical protein